MINLYVIVIITLLGVLLSKMLKGVFRPYSISQIRKSNEDRMYTSNSSFSFDDLQNKVARRIPIKHMNEDLAQDINSKLERLSIDMVAEDIRKLQILYFLVTILIAVIARHLMGSMVGWIIGIGSIYAWNFPVMHINSLIVARNEAIETELPEMYSVLYYVYRRNASTSLTLKVQSYIRDSSELFYKEMMLFIEDSRNGEQYALQQFKKRVPLGIVQRFCDIMESRLEGYDNISVMENFKNEMDERRSARETKLLTELAGKLDKISWIGIMIPIGMILTVYFAGQLISSTQGF